MDFPEGTEEKRTKTSVNKVGLRITLNYRARRDKVSITEGKEKVKITLEQTTKAQKGSRSVALLFL